MTIHYCINKSYSSKKLTINRFIVNYNAPVKSFVITTEKLYAALSGNTLK